MKATTLLAALVDKNSALDRPPTLSLLVNIDRHGA
jgi:hypothetical protein